MSRDYTISNQVRQQRQEAPIKHGAYSRKMTPEKASRLSELEERLSTRPGLVEVQREQTAKAVELANVILSWVITEHKKGKPLDRIPALNKLASYMNTANRAIWQLHNMLPDDKKVLDLAEHVQRAMNGDGDDS